MISFVGEGIFAPVLDSQVIVPLGRLGREAPHIRRALLILTSIRFKGKPAVAPREQDLRNALPGVQLLLKYRPMLNFPCEQRFWARRLRAAIAACGYDGPDPIVIHCRGQTTAAAAAVVKHGDPRIRILFDIRGAQEDEVNRPGLYGRYLTRLAGQTFDRAVCNADAVNTVSRKLAEHLVQHGGLRPQTPILVTGCCVDTHRFHFDPQVRVARRRKLGLDGRFVVCYCGAMSHWQRPDAIAEAFTAIRGAMPDAHMLIVSREASLLVEELSRRNVPSDQITIQASSHDQVGSYLMAGDVGLLLRENTLTNRVASPVKFAEYLRCGLPVILTHYVGDFSTLVLADDVGRVVEFPVQAGEMVEAVTALRQRLDREGDVYRQHCSRIAGERLSWEGKLPELVRLYESFARR